MNQPRPTSQQILSVDKSKNQIDTHQSWTVWLDKIKLTDISLVGGKNASLGEMIQNLGDLGVKVPHGFAVTTLAYRQFIASAGLDRKLSYILADLDAHDVDDLIHRSSLAQSLILETPFPLQLENAIKLAYRKLCNQYGYEVDVAVRSSATAEDLPHASFAGQQETYLNVCGEKTLLES
ncbi:MAG: hypothetical protein RLZZ499_1891, partial [Cyanobacteriota bacterium]